MSHEFKHFHEFAFESVDLDASDAEGKATFRRFKRDSHSGRFPLVVITTSEDDDEEHVVGLTDIDVAALRELLDGKHDVEAYPTGTVAKNVHYGCLYVREEGGWTTYYDGMAVRWQGATLERCDEIAREHVTSGEWTLLT